MANTKISALPAGAPAQSTDLLPIDRAGANYSLQVSDILASLSALPNGTTATTQAALDGSTKVATDAYADAAVAVEKARALAAEALLAPLASPALTGTPTAPTQAALTSNTDIATTAYVDSIFLSGGIAQWEDDFLVLGSTVTVSSSGLVLTSQGGPWYCGPISSGTTGTVTPTATAAYSNPGLVVLSTPATSGDGIWMCLGQERINIGALGNSGITPPWYLDFWIELGSVSNICVRVGAFTANEFNISPPTNGVWCEFDTANSNSNTDWTLSTGNGTSTNYVASSVVPSATTWYHIRLFSTVAGTIQMVISTVNGAFSAAVSSGTDVPTGGLLPTIQIVPRANTAETITIDRVSYYGATGRL